MDQVAPRRSLLPLVVAAALLIDLGLIWIAIAIYGMVV